MALCDELVLILDAWRLFGGVLLFLQSRSRCRTLSTREARAAPCVVTIRILHLKHKTHDIEIRDKKLAITSPCYFIFALFFMLFIIV